MTGTGLRYPEEVFWREENGISSLVWNPRELVRVSGGVHVGLTGLSPCEESCGPTVLQSLLLCEHAYLGHVSCSCYELKQCTHFSAHQRLYRPMLLTAN